MRSKNYLRDQAIALSLTVVTCAVLIGAVWLEIKLLNPHLSDPILMTVTLGSVLIGLTVYLKTAIDFALFVGLVMAKNPGLKGRIGIEFGTALGNGIGTMLVLLIWAFFKEVDWLLAIMILLASLVLLRLAEDTLEHATLQHNALKRFTLGLERMLHAINRVTNPVLSRIVPSNSIKVEHKKTFLALLAMAFTVPFILGLDNFAGYIPIFNVVNVLGFSIGALLGHMILNISLYLSPSRTVKAVKNPIFALLGSVVFTGLAAWGIYEVVHSIVA